MVNVGMWIQWGLAFYNFLGFTATDYNCMRCLSFWGLNNLFKGCFFVFGDVAISKTNMQTLPLYLAPSFIYLYLHDLTTRYTPLPGGPSWNFDRRASQSTNGCLVKGRIAPSLLGEKRWNLNESGGMSGGNKWSIYHAPSDRGGNIFSNVFGYQIP